MEHYRPYYCFSKFANFDFFLDPKTSETAIFYLKKVKVDIFFLIVIFFSNERKSKICPGNFILRKKNINILNKNINLLKHQNIPIWTDFGIKNEISLMWWMMIKVMRMMIHLLLMKPFFFSTQLKLSTLAAFDT